MEGDSSDVVGVALECHQRIWVTRLGVKQLDIVVAGDGEELLVRGDAKPVDLRVRVLDGAGTNARQDLPEAAVTELRLARV